MNDSYKIFRNIREKHLENSYFLLPSGDMMGMVFCSPCIKKAKREKMPGLSYARVMENIGLSYINGID